MTTALRMTKLPHRWVPLAVSLAALAGVVGLSACKPGRTNATPDHLAPPAQATPPSETDPPVTPIVPLTPGARTEDEKNTVSVFRELAPATVFVTQTRVVADMWGASEEVPAGSGSGFVWDKQGHIVTNFHVIKDAKSLSVTFQGQKTFQATVVGADPRKDIAVLKVDAGPELLVPVTTPKVMQLEVGQKTIAIGNPFALDHTLTTGVISALGRQVDGIGGVTIREMIQTDAAINPGNSGGPLLDSSGQLIGMNTMIFSKSGSSAGIGFAVPVSAIARVVPQIIKTGHAEQLGLGIQIDTQGRINRSLRIAGVVVVAVPKDSPAASSGLQGLKDTPRGVALGDVIVGVDETKVDTYDDLYNALDRHTAGDTVNVKVRRADATVTLPMKVSILN